MPAVLLGLLVVIGVALLVRPAPSTADGELPLRPPVEDRDEDGDVAEAPVAALPATGGRWVQLEPAPVRPPALHHAVWTGTELIVFGLGGEVGAYDAVNRLWWSRAPVPASAGPRWQLVPPVWTGAEVLVVSGDPGAPMAHAFDPVADTWRRLAAPPAEVVSPAVSVWSGDSYVLWGAAGGPRVREDGPAVGGVYDPETDTWRRLGNGPVLNVATVAGVATDGGVVVWGRQPGRGEESAAPFAARFTPGPDRWEALPPPPLNGPASAAAVWTGPCADGPRQPRSAALGEGCGEVVLWGRPTVEQGPRGGASGAALDYGSEVWRPLPTAAGFGGRAGAIRASGVAGVWTGETMLIAGGSAVPAFLALDAQGWSTLPDRAPLRRPAVAWTGEELLVWGGIGANGSTAALRAWRPGP